MFIEHKSVMENTFYEVYNKTIECSLLLEFVEFSNHIINK